MRPRGSRASGYRSVEALDEELRRDPPALVLVDCFGTLVHRRVPSGRVRELAAADLAAAVGLDPGEVTRQRIECERSLSRQLGEPGRPRDFRLPDLAAALYPVLQTTRTVTSEEFCRLFCAIEVSVESAVAQPNSDLVGVLRRLPDGVALEVLSDTNLTAAMLGAVLAAHALDDLADEIVVSCDAGETKRSGHLYRAVLDSAGTDPAETVMIGDHPVADGEEAARAGVRPLLVAGGRWDAVKAAPVGKLRADLKDRLREALAPREGEVFPELALTLWLFTDRLDRELRRQGAGDVVFLAREGAFLEELFDRRQRSGAGRGREPVTSAYLLTSRKSTLVPSLKDPEPDLLALQARLPGITAEALQTMLGISVPTGEPATAAPLTAEDLAALCRRDEFVVALSERRDEQQELLRALVDQVAPDPGRLHTVDIGWKGTVRDHLAVALGRPVSAHLLGLVIGDAATDLDQKVGHLFANQPVRTPHFQIFSHFKGLYELLLAAPHGSVSAYERDEQGNVRAVLDDNGPEKEVHDSHIAPFQQACLARFDDVADLLAVEDEPSIWFDGVVAGHHARMMYRPSDAELDFVEGLMQFDNFGAGVLEVPGDKAGGEPHRRGPRRHVAGGGWPPLRMRRSHASWQRRPYGALKTAQRWMGRLR